MSCKRSTQQRACCALAASTKQRRPARRRRSLTGQPPTYAAYLVDDHIKRRAQSQLCDAHPHCGIFELVRRKPVEFIGRDNKNKFSRI
jgi:hypothetical protein